ncbi:hypothetical protein SAMN04488059_1433 [Devosia psychrophila]|uniref:Uncharacterized protein n=1 Tax=Devosia psychrophila TaxID=728005 RepID=A0A1I1RIJ2_9HYPH|nr:hypothetical protein SAMN04488059_1433 [Devosia psychrophila]
MELSQWQLMRTRSSQPLLSATSMRQRVLHKNSPSPNALWEPQNHLFAMAAELALKAFLERAEVLEKELKRQSVRQSLNGLLLLAVSKGLRTSHEVAEVLMEMDEAHSSHAYRYVPRPEEGEAVTVHSARPANAYAAIQRLLDQCAADPFNRQNTNQVSGGVAPSASAGASHHRRTAAGVDCGKTRSPRPDMVLRSDDVIFLWPALCAKIMEVSRESLGPNRCRLKKQP